MKKLLSVLLTLMLCAAMLPQACADTGTHTIAERSFPFYVGSIDATLTKPFSLYFFDGVDDLPYVELDSWGEFMILFYHDLIQDPGYKLSASWDGPQVILTRENGWSMSLDFEKDAIAFDDYNGFIHNSSDSALLDLLSMSGFSEDGEPELFLRNPASAFDRQGKVIELSLADYDIHLIMHDGKYYIPLQTLNDFLLSTRNASLLFNGRELILMFGNGLGNSNKGYTDLGELYYSVPQGERSPELAHYSYCELCLVLDCLYGLKESHDIQSFDRLFAEIGFKSALQSTDPATADDALNRFIEYYLDDLHSSFNASSYLTGKTAVSDIAGLSYQRLMDNLDRYGEARDKAYPDGIPAYEEVGDTAYITLDAFKSNTASEYYENKDSDDFYDTVSLVIYAHRQITREDSPIKTVVLDLSKNLGGDVDAALFVMSWFLGQAPFSVKDTFTGAQSTAIYQADVNLDRRFDASDTLQGKNLVCLISPVSFSCGNLVPAVFKSSQQVTLLGTTSGGGSCTVLRLSTAHGATFQTSGAQRMSFLKNGSFYDIDQGIEPNYYINSISNYYDRQALTEFIHGLF